MSRLSAAEQEAAEILADLRKPETEPEPATATNKKKAAPGKTAKAPRKITRAAKAAGVVPPPPSPGEEVAAPTEEVVAPTAPSPTEETTTAEPVVVVSVPTPPAAVEREAVSDLPPAQPVRIEEPGVSAVGRRSTIAGRRWHQRFLPNMQGAYLTLLDDEKRILLFVMGALRVRTSDTTDTVFHLSTADVFRGMLGVGASAPFQPEVQKIPLEGEERRRAWVLKLTEIPAFTNMLGIRIPEAAHWGVLTTGVDPTLRQQGVLPNGVNSEFQLMSSSWKAGDRIPGSSVKDMSVRLAPRAAEYAATIPSAWLLALTGAALFGGMKVPTAVKVPSSVALSGLVKAEMELRARKKAAAEARRNGYGADFGMSLGALIPSSPFGDDGQA